MLPRKTIRSSAAFFGKSLSPFLPSPRPRLRVRLRFAIRFYESAEPHAQCQTGAIFPAGTRIAGHLNPRTYLTSINVDSPRTKARSEEHTSELQSLAYLVCRLLLEKKKASTRLVLPHATNVLT